MKSILSRVKTTRVGQRRYKAIVDLTQPRRMSATRLSLVTGAMFLSVATTSVLVASPAAMANTTTLMGVHVTAASETSNCSNDNCNWTVTADVTIQNDTNSSMTISNVGNSVTWYKGQSGKGHSTTNVTIVTNAGLSSGTVIGAGKTMDFPGYQVSFKIPSSAKIGDLAVSVTTGAGTFSGDGQFLSSGNPLPVGTIGGLIVVAAIGGVGMEVTRRHRRNARQHVSK